MLIAGNTPEENFRILHTAGCIQTLCNQPVDEAFEKGFKVFCMLMIATKLNPCDECPAWIGCDAYKQYSTGVAAKRRLNEARIKDATTANNGIGTLSVKQIAEKYCVSKKLVRRLKVQGKLDLETLEALKGESCT